MLQVDRNHKTQFDSASADIIFSMDHSRPEASAHAEAIEDGDRNMAGKAMTGRWLAGDEPADAFGLLPEELAELAQAAVEIGCIDLAEELIGAAYDRLDGVQSRSLAACLRQLRQSTRESDHESPVVDRIRQLLCPA